MRDPALQTLIDRLEAAFLTCALSDPARQALDRVFDRLRQPAAAGHPKAEPLAVTALLPQALEPLRQGKAGPSIAALAEAIAALGPVLPWATRKVVGPTASAGFAGAHANAYLIGPGALEDRADVMVGLSLMAPATRYPDHDHPPEEVYLVLSDGAFLQGEADWLPRQPGQTVYNTPGIRHAMRAGDQPFLALWCLPV